MSSAPQKTGLNLLFSYVVLVTTEGGIFSNGPTPGPEPGWGTGGCDHPAPHPPVQVYIPGWGSSSLLTDTASLVCGELEQYTEHMKEFIVSTDRQTFRIDVNVPAVLQMISPRTHRWCTFSITRYYKNLQQRSATSLFNSNFSDKLLRRDNLQLLRQSLSGHERIGFRFLWVWTSYYINVQQLPFRVLPLQLRGFRREKEQRTQSHADVPDTMHDKIVGIGFQSWGEDQAYES